MGFALPALLVRYSKRTRILHFRHRLRISKIGVPTNRAPDEAASSFCYNRRMRVAKVVGGPLALSMIVGFGADDLPAPTPQLTAQAAAAATTPTATTLALTTGTLRGRVAVLPRKPAPPTKDYGAKPAIKVEPAESATSCVWISSASASASAPLDPATAPVARIEQQGFQFRPALTIVQTGTPIVFPNEDTMYHSVFSYSDTKRFDLGRYLKGEERDAIVFDKPGLVQLFCEVHEHMRATVIVVDTPWFARTQPDGSFEISGIAPGTHTVTIWLSPKKQVERSIDLAAGQTLEVDWATLVENPSK